WTAPLGPTVRVTSAGNLPRLRQTLPKSVTKPMTVGKIFHLPRLTMTPRATRATRAKPPPPKPTKPTKPTTTPSSQRHFLLTTLQTMTSKPTQTAAAEAADEAWERQQTARWFKDLYYLGTEIIQQAQITNVVVPQQLLREVVEPMAAWLPTIRE